MRRLNIAYPAYALDPYNWDRIAAALKPISNIHNIQVFSYEDRQPPDVDWCTFTKIPPPCDLFNLDATNNLAMKIIAFLDDFDLLYCWSSGAYFQLLNVLIAQLAKKPIVMHLNGDGTLSRKHHLKDAERLKENAMDYITLNNADALIPISSILQQATAARVKNTNRITEPIPFTVDTNHFKPYPHPKELTIGYSGRVSPEKGFPWILNVMQETLNINYRVAGPLQMQVNFPENCHYAGLYRLHEMPLYYALCSAVALPSYGEGMPAAILEAYATGRPVICTPESRPRELPLFGWELERNLDLWISRMETLTTEECVSQGMKARDWITKEWHTWTDFAAKMSEVFTSAVRTS